MQDFRFYIFSMLVLSAAIFLAYCAFWANMQEVDKPSPVFYTPSLPRMLSISLGYSGGVGTIVDNDSDGQTDTAAEADVLLQIRNMLGAMLGLMTFLLACGVVWIILYPLRVLSR